VVLATTTVSFDVAGTELWLPLLAGARVAIAPADCPGNPAAMGRAVARFRPTVMQCTPTTWRLLMDAGFRGPSRLRAISMGEALPAGLAGQVLEAGLDLWNLYGPTETTIYSTGERVCASRAVTVGRPLPNQAAYVVDAELRPVPVGVPGRLLLGGEGLASGYRGRPDLTAERFVPDPLSGRAGARLYDTGDVARWRSDGRLEYLGRADNQVKVNGVRVEPGEVEHRLAAHDAIERAVVTARPDRRGVRRLVAYLLAAAGPPRPTPAELRRWLRRDLPDPMVPPEFVWVDAFPTTPNGKLDVKALPSPAPPSADREHVAPATPTEAALADIWREVLAVERIGRADDFFDLGGHSLAALRVVEMVSESLGVTLRADALFDAPTLADLAALLSGSD
jgi:acyl-coenzyme A synthetase/AMP-(fatty) acid ligase/acyl carrier protein